MALYVSFGRSTAGPVCTVDQYEDLIFGVIMYNPYLGMWEIPLPEKIPSKKDPTEEKSSS